MAKEEKLAESTDQPDVPIMESVATGAGEHHPPAEPEVEVAEKPAQKEAPKEG